MYDVGYQVIPVPERLFDAFASLFGVGLYAFIACIVHVCQCVYLLTYTHVHACTLYLYIHYSLVPACIQLHICFDGHADDATNFFVSAFFSSTKQMDM